MDILYNFSFTLSTLLLLSSIYLLVRRIIHPFSLNVTLINLKNCILHPENIDSYIGIFFSLIFLVIPIFIGLMNFLKTDGNVVVIIFTIAWIYNWIKYTFLSDKFKLENILQKNHPFYEKYLVNLPHDTDQKDNLRNGLKKIHEEYNISFEIIGKIYPENPYWQRLCGREYFESNPISIQDYSDLAINNVAQMEYQKTKDETKPNVTLQEDRKTSSSNQKKGNRKSSNK